MQFQDSMNWLRDTAASPAFSHAFQTDPLPSSGVPVATQTPGKVMKLDEN